MFRTFVFGINAIGCFWAGFHELFKGNTASAMQLFALGLIITELA